MSKTNYSFKDKAGNVALVDLDLVRKAASFARAIDHPLRLAILKKLDGTQLSVTEIYRNWKYKGKPMEQAVTSAQLRILRDANIVIAERDGINVRYSVNTEAIEHNLALLTNLK